MRHCVERRSAGRQKFLVAIAGKGEVEARTTPTIRRLIPSRRCLKYGHHIIRSQGPAYRSHRHTALIRRLELPHGAADRLRNVEIATALETVLDARRQRIIISQSQVNLLKWSILFMQAVCALVAIAMVHSDNRFASIIAMGIFATGVAASMLLILAHDRPFTGEISIRPDALLQVMPEIGT